MKLALLFFGLIAAYLLIGWLISFPIQLRSYTLSSPKIKTLVRLAVVSDPVSYTHLLTITQTLLKLVCYQYTIDSNGLTA